MWDRNKSLSNHDRAVCAGPAQTGERLERLRVKRLKQVRLSVTLLWIFFYRLASP